MNNNNNGNSTQINVNPKIEIAGKQIIINTKIKES